MENRIDAALSDADRDAILTRLEQVKSLLPFLQDLTPEQRRTLPKMGDKSVAFVEGTGTLVERDTSFLPRSFDTDEFLRDVALFKALLPIRAELVRLTELVDDTTMAVGSDAFVAGLIVYQNAKTNGKGAGLDDLLDELGQRFARKSQSSKNEAPTP